MRMYSNLVVNYCLQASYSSETLAEPNLDVTRYTTYTYSVLHTVHAMRFALKILSGSPQHTR